MLVAAYGTLKSGFSNHGVLEDPVHIADVEIEGFDMYSLGAFPFISDGEGTITAEIYEVPDSNLASLDMLEGYPGFYNRKEIEIDGIGSVTIYFINKNEYVDNRKIDDGVWREYER